MAFIQIFRDFRRFLRAKRRATLPEVIMIESVVLIFALCLNITSRLANKTPATQRWKLGEPLFQIESHAVDILLSNSAFSPGDKSQEL